jgi:hypothetical protein
MRILLTSLALLSLCAAFPGIAAGQAVPPPPPSPVPAPSPSFSALLDQLDTEIAGILADGKHSNDESRRMISLAAQIHRELARANFEMIRSTLSELVETIPTPQGRQIVTQLQQALPGAIAAAQDAVAAQVAALRDKAARLCMESKNESDFDPLFNEIDALRIGGANQIDEREQEKLEAARQFLGQWQKYVAQDSAGYDAAALNTLRTISENPTAFPLAPLSYINAQIDRLAQSDPSARIEKILSAVKTLDDLPAGIAALKSLSLHGPEASAANMIITELAGLDSGAAALKSGDYAAALSAIATPPVPQESAGFQREDSRPSFPAVVMDSQVFTGLPAATYFSLRRQLLNALVPAYLGLAESSQPNPGEDPSQYLLRLAGAAAGRGDFGQVSQILGTYKVCAFNNSAPPWVDAAIAASSAYYQGQKLEQAGSFAAALSAYERVLEQEPSQYSPVAQATARITALRKDHPAEINKANPPPPTIPASPLGG